MDYSDINGKKIYMPFQTITSLGDLVHIEQAFLNNYVCKISNPAEFAYLSHYMEKVFTKLVRAYKGIDCSDRDQARANLAWLKQGCPKSEKPSKEF